MAANTVPITRVAAGPPAAALAGSQLTAPGFLSGEERSALEGAVLSARSVKAGQSLLAEGETADRLHFVVKGWAIRFKTTRSGGRQIVALIVPGDVANPDTLMFEVADYGLETLTDMVVVALSRDRALALIARHPGIARTFTWLAFIESAAMAQRLLCLGRKSAQQRLAHFFCELGARLHAADDGESSYRMPLTQELIADVLGLTAVHINRTMQQLRAGGLIVTGGGSVTITDVDRLRTLAEFDPAYLHRAPTGLAA